MDKLAEPVGQVTHFYDRLGVAIVELLQGQTGQGRIPYRRDAGLTIGGPLTDDPQLVEPEVLPRPRRRADVTGFAGGDEDDA